jgi:hypothetical protein
MKRLSRAAVLVLVAFSVPVAVELRTVFGFFGVDLPIMAVVLFEVVILALIFGVYALGELRGEDEEAAA